MESLIADFSFQYSSAIAKFLLPTVYAKIFILRLFDNSRVHSFSGDNVLVPFHFW